MAYGVKSILFLILAMNASRRHGGNTGKQYIEIAVLSVRNAFCGIMRSFPALL
jgi:hypothetical protein